MSAHLYVIAKNLHRRHLTTAQRAAIGVEMLSLFRAEARQRQEAGLKRGDDSPSKPIGLMEILTPLIGGEHGIQSGFPIWPPATTDCTDHSLFRRIMKLAGLGVLGAAVAPFQLVGNFLALG